MSDQRHDPILIASDHAGFELKEKLRAALEGMGYDVQDLGTRNPDSTDYADYAHPLAAKVEAVPPVMTTRTIPTRTPVRTSMRLYGSL